MRHSPSHSDIRAWQAMRRSAGASRGIASTADTRFVACRPSAPMVAACSVMRVVDHGGSPSQMTSPHGSSCGMMM